MPRWPRPPMPRMATRSPGHRAGVAERVESRHAGIHERRRVDGAEPVGDAGQHRPRRDDVVGIAAVEVDPGDPEIVSAGQVVAAATAVAVAAVPAMPADAGAVARLPFGDVRADRVDDAGDLVAGNARQRDPWPESLDRQHVAMADPAGFDADADLPGTGLRDVALDERELRGGFRNGERAHPGHGILLSVGRFRDMAVRRNCNSPRPRRRVQTSGNLASKTAPPPSRFAAVIRPP